MRLDLVILKCIDRQNAQVGHINTNKTFQNATLVAENDHITPESLHICRERTRGRRGTVAGRGAALEVSLGKYGGALV